MSIDTTPQVLNANGIFEVMDEKFQDNVTSWLSEDNSNTVLLRTQPVAPVGRIYLAAAPAEQQQHLNCVCCTTFLGRWGSLVVGNEKGEIHSPFWKDFEASDELEEEVRVIFGKIRQLVESAKVVGPFALTGGYHGHVTTGGWDHFALTVEQFAKIKKLPGTLTDPKVFELKLVNYRSLGVNIQRHYRLVEMEATLLKMKHGVFTSNSSVAKMLEYHIRIAKVLMEVSGDVKRNRMWYFAITGYGTLNLSDKVLLVLLDMVHEGMADDVIQAAWRPMIASDNYLRPKEAPQERLIKEAESLIAELGLEPSLDRRAARIDELLPHATWEPVKNTEKSGVFGHLRTKEDDSADSENSRTRELLRTTPKPVTWREFVGDILPTAQSVQLVTRGMVSGYGGINTAVNDDAPPIIKWDKMEKRNPFTHYVTNQLMRVTDTPLTDVLGVIPLPNMWSGDSTYIGAFLPLKDTNKPDVGGIALFPRMLIPELHQIRSVMESYSNSSTLQDMDAGVYGICVFEEMCDINLTMAVVMAGTKILFTVDRW